MSQIPDKYRMFSSARSSVIFGVLKGVVAISVLAAIAYAWKANQKPKEEVTLGPPQLSAERIGELVTLRLHYANVLEFFQKRAQDIPGTPYELRLGGTRILMVVRGDCEISTNLQAARYEQVDTSRKTLRVVLPSPRMVRPRISHAPKDAGGSYFYTVTSEGTEIFVPRSENQKKAVNNAWVAAEKDLAAYCSAPRWVVESKGKTEEILRPIFLTTGWVAFVAWD